MLCFEIAVNDERICTAGVGEEGVLSTIVSWVDHRREGEEAKRKVDLHIGGLVNEQHINWIEGFEKLRVGDVLTVRIVESDSADPPIKAEEAKRRKNEKVGEPSSKLRCSFCNKSQAAVQKLIAGPTVYICNECVDICVDILQKEKSPSDGGESSPDRTA